MANTDKAPAPLSRATLLTDPLPLTREERIALKTLRLPGTNWPASRPAPGSGR